jgi:8-oxo-dGTP pyrophosphatase MutT (NUDIX family)
MQDDKAPEISAGVVVIRDDPKRGPCVLTLRIGKKLDLPKGHVEQVHFETALRVDPILLCAADELFQEADYTLLPEGSELLASEPVAVMISPERFMCRNIDKKTGRTRKNVHLYVAETINSRALIKPNPETGIKEHDEVVWVPFSKVSSSDIHPYLMLGVDWAIEKYRVFHSI